MNFILYAVPIFFLLIITELLLEKIKGTDYYRVNDTINSLSAGILSRMVSLVKQLVPVTFYVIAYEHLAVFDLPDTQWVWIFAFILYDFFYYWNHRLGHEMNILWAAHVVHHSSEEYNLSTALRQTSGSFFSWIFYLPMAVLGFDPLMLISVGSLNLIYQFWVHTRHVPKLGWYEWLFVTPSNHRVHHAQNPIYIDRNYGGVFIIWDRIFGSFQEELDDEKPIYGIRKALRSWDPIWANMQVYSQLAKDCWHAEKLTDKCLVWFKRTGWRPTDVEKRYPLAKTDLTKFEKFDTPLSLGNKLYSLLQYVTMVFVGLMLLLNLSNLSASQQLLSAGFVFYSSVSIGNMLGNKRTAIWLEWLKHAITLIGLACILLPNWITLPLSIMLASSCTILLFKGKGLVSPSPAKLA